MTGEPMKTQSTLLEDSFSVPAIGRQHDSKKDTMPAFSFGTGTRDAARQKVFLSHKHEKHKAIVTSPGPVYSVPTSVGTGPRFGFGTDEQRKHSKAKYPDSSVDLTCAMVDTQVVKYKSTESVHFGTECRMNWKNAEIIRTHPGCQLGQESPGGLEYSPDEWSIASHPPEYSFGPRNQDGPGERIKDVPRLALPLTSTPRGIGPGSHRQPSCLGSQSNSQRSSAPSYSFGSEERNKQRYSDRQLLDTAPNFSSLGKQLVSHTRTAPMCGFGSSTRAHAAKTHLVQLETDKGPAANMPKANFSLNLPPPDRTAKRPGL